MHADYKLIGIRMRDIRRKKGMTQEKLAEMLGVTIGYVSQMERGITKISLETLASVADLLECDLAELVTGASTSSAAYLTNEIAQEASLLCDRDRKFLLDVISLLLNRDNTR